VESGAVFLVSPILDPRVIAEARALNVAVIPGAHSPTELWQAYQLGAPLQKLFPEPAGGAAYIRSCLSPMPFLRIIPTRGVNESNVAEYLKAGAYAVGFGDTLFPAEAMALEQYDRIERRARILRTAVEFP
jgi:Entner-Doudoroff aldolase